MLANTDAVGWRYPFFALGGLGCFVLGLAFFLLPAMRGHMEAGDEKEQTRLTEVLTTPTHWPAYLLMGVLIVTSFAMGPFLPAFTVNNIGHRRMDLPWIYLCGGLATLLTTNLVGRLADRYSRTRIFRIMATTTVVPYLLFVYLPHGTPLVLVLAVTTLMMVTTSARMVPAMAMITGSASPRMRGGFLSVLTALQQMAIGVSAWFAGWVLGSTEGSEPLVGFPILGWVAAGGNLLCVLLIGLLKPAKDDRAVDVIPESGGEEDEAEELPERIPA